MTGWDIVHLPHIFWQNFGMSKKHREAIWCDSQSTIHRIDLQEMGNVPRNHGFHMSIIEVLVEKVKKNIWNI